MLLAHRPIVDTVRVFVDGNELQHGPRDIDPNTDGIQLDPDDHFNGPARFKVSGNTVTFLDDKGFAERRVGIVQVIYDYKEAGYDNSVREGHRRRHLRRGFADGHHPSGDGRFGRLIEVMGP